MLHTSFPSCLVGKRACEWPGTCSMGEIMCAIQLQMAWRLPKAFQRLTRRMGVRDLTLILLHKLSGLK